MPRGMVRLAAAHEAIALLIDLALMANIALYLRSDGIVEFPDEQGGVCFYARACIFAAYDIQCACWTIEFACTHEFPTNCYLRAVLKRPMHPLYSVFREVFACLVSPTAALPVIAGLEPRRFIGTGLRRVSGKNKLRECVTFMQGVRSAGDWAQCFGVRNWCAVREEQDFGRRGMRSWTLPLDHIPPLFEVGDMTIPLRGRSSVFFKYDESLYLPRFFSDDHKLMLKQGQQALGMLQECSDLHRSNGVLHSRFRVHQLFRRMFQNDEESPREGSRSRSRSR